MQVTCKLCPRKVLCDNHGWMALCKCTYKVHYIWMSHLVKQQKFCFKLVANFPTSLTQKGQNLVKNHTF